MKLVTGMFKFGMGVCAVLMALVAFNFFTGVINERLQHNALSILCLVGFGAALAAFAHLYRKIKKTFLQNEGEK